MLLQPQTPYRQPGGIPDRVSDVVVEFDGWSRRWAQV